MKQLKSYEGREDIIFIAIDLETSFFPDRHTGLKAVYEVGATWYYGGSTANQKIRDETYHWIVKEFKNRHNNNKFKGSIYDHKNEFFDKSDLISIHKVGRELMK